VIIHKAASRRRHFTIVDNATLQDARLSYRARGVLAYLLSLPDGGSPTTASLLRSPWRVSEPSSPR
jgi:hypothetical protein